MTNLFLTRDKFMKQFPPVKISKSEFVDIFRVTYKGDPSLSSIFDLSNIQSNKSVIKSTSDARYKNKTKIIEYFYDVIVANRYKYLDTFYNSYFHFDNPYELKWDKNSTTPLVELGKLEPSLLDEFNYSEIDKDRFIEILEYFIENNLTIVSVQKNDGARVLIRNLNYQDILHLTKITNTSKCRVSFWQTLLNVYNDLVLEDRFFAPSSIGLYLRTKANGTINFNNFFYLFQQYQPKASILNPFTIYWILENYFKGRRLFTPVLSWCSYLMAFYHSDYESYVGVDVMKNVCDRAEFLATYYSTLNQSNAERHVDIWCRPSESLLHCSKFMKTYTNYFDTVLWCPPYFDMEIYQSNNQSVTNYPDYEEWLEKYFHQTVLLVNAVCKRGSKIGVIMNDYSNLQGRYYPLIQDFVKILRLHFSLVNIIELANRVSPLRVNKRSRSEKLFIFQKE